VFIQVMQGRCTDADRLGERLDLWRDSVSGGADGWLGTTSGITGDGQFVGVVRFESREAASANSSRPEQDAWWQGTAAVLGGDVAFADYDDVVTMLDGGSDEAGFVQVMRGRVADPAAFRTFMAQPMDALHEARPEIIGGTVAVDDDGGFTQTVYFTDEASARLGEKQEIPAEVQRQMEEGMGQMEVEHFLDLHDPWFYGRA
jgi:hypothetical protein